MEGKKPTFLLIHGAGHTAMSWALVAVRWNWNFGGFKLI